MYGIEVEFAGDFHWYAAPTWFRSKHLEKIRKAQGPLLSIGWAGARGSDLAIAVEVFDIVPKDL